MKFIFKVFLLFVFTLVASPSLVHCKAIETEINTFVRKVEGAGRLAASVKASDGSYVTVSGDRYYATSFLVRKMEVSGKKQWERKLSFQNVTYVRGIVQTTDGGFVLAGYECQDVYCFDAIGTILIKLGPDGSLAWNKRLELINGTYTLFESVIATSDGGVIGIGTFSTLDGRLNGILIERFNAAGDIVWAKDFEGDGVKFVSMATQDKGFVVAVRTGNENPNAVDVMKITESGAMRWRKLLSADDFIFQSGAVTQNNKIILVGNGIDSNKLKVILLTADGTITWKAEYSLKIKGGIDYISSPVETSDGGFAMTGETNHNSANNYSGFIAKIDTTRKVAFQNIFKTEESFGESVFANEDGSYVLLGSVNDSLLVSKLNSAGNTSCGFFRSLGATTHTSFGPINVSRVSTTESDDLLSANVKSDLSSVATNHRVSDLCQ